MTDDAYAQRLGLLPALDAVFGGKSGSLAGDMRRASFRRKALRHGAYACALAIVAMHVISVLVVAIAYPGPPFAFIWSLWFLLPTLAVHVLGAMIFGVLLTLMLLCDGILIRQVMRSSGVIKTGLAVIGALFAGIVAAAFGLANPLTAVSGDPALFLPSLAPAVGGLLWGWVLGGRLTAHLDQTAVSAIRAGAVASRNTAT